MNVEAVIVERLVADAAVAALVSGRVFLLKLPQRVTLPAIRVQLIDEPLGYHLRGEHGCARARVQVDCYAAEASGGNSYTSASDVADSVDDALSGQKFENIGSPVSISVSGCFREDRRTLYEDADDRKLVRVMQDYYVWSRKIA